jgi:hypothetical protein
VYFLCTGPGLAPGFLLLFDNSSRKIAGVSLTSNCRSPKPNLGVQIPPPAPSLPAKQKWILHRSHNPVIADSGSAAGTTYVSLLDGM